MSLTQVKNMGDLEAERPMDMVKQLLCNSCWENNQDGDEKGI